MKSSLFFPVLTVAGGAAAFVLRLLFCRTGYEPGTGLPVPGNPYGTALIIVLAALVVILFLTVRRLPAEQADAPVSFADGFSTSSTALLMLPAAGMFLLAASGVMDLAAGVLPGPMAIGDGGTFLPAAAGPFSQREYLIMGVLSLLSAAGLFAALPACRRRQDAGAAGRPGGLLVSVCCLVVRLVFSYRIHSVNPSLVSYYVELLALVFLILGIFRLSSFAFQAGRTRWFVLFAVPAAVLCFASLADGLPLAEALLYGGGGLLMLGFLLLRLKAQPTAP